VGSGRSDSGTQAQSHSWCSRMRPAGRGSSTGSNPASTPPTVAVDHGRWPTVANPPLVGSRLVSPAGRIDRRPLPVGGCWLVHPAGRTARHPRPVADCKLVRPARRPRPVLRLASGSWPRGPRPDWGWSGSGLAVGPAPTRLPAPWCWIRLPGRTVCPSSWNRGPVDAVACREATRGKRWSQRTRPSIKLAGHWSARVPGWLVGACGWGRACQARPARSVHPGRGGRTRLPPRGPLAGPLQVARDESCYAKWATTTKPSGR
jgi:hypothetical protein